MSETTGLRALFGAKPSATTGVSESEVDQLRSELEAERLKAAELVCHVPKRKWPRLIDDPVLGPTAKSIIRAAYYECERRVSVMRDSFNCRIDRELLMRCGVTDFRKRGRPVGERIHAERDAKIVEMRKSGATMQLIAESYGITRQRVNQILARESARR